MDRTRSEPFDVKVRVYQRSILSPYQFALVMDEVIKDIREGTVKEMLYAGDLVLVGRTEIVKFCMGGGFCSLDRTLLACESTLVKIA